MASITNQLNRELSLSLLSSIRNKQTRLYLYFGQPNQVVNTLVPGSQEYISNTRNNIIAAKEVLPSNACLVIPRKDYLENIEYKKWNSYGRVFDYVYNTSNFSIYICTQEGSGLSTIIPTHTTATSEVYSDGYAWQYIYTIPLPLRDMFLTSDWIPVSNALGESYFSDGGIISVSILDGGEGYLKDNTSLIVTGQGAKGGGAIVEPIIENGSIVNVIIHNPGYGYISPLIEVVTSGTPTRPAVIKPNMSKGDIRSRTSLIQILAVPGTIESIDVLDGGSGYTENVQVVLDGDGKDGQISFTRNATTGSISDITLVNKGTGYTWAKLIVTDTEFGGSGLEVEINLSPIMGFGRNPVSDLGASDIMIFQTLSRERTYGLKLDNSIYQYGIISNPKTTDNYDYPSTRVNAGNYITTLPLDQIVNYSIGDIITNEFPVTSNTKNFLLEEKVIGKTRGSIRLRATNGGNIVAGVRYYKDATLSFIADYGNYNQVPTNQYITACYFGQATSPATFDINIFTVGKVLKLNNRRFVIVAISTQEILLSSIDGGVLADNSVLVDSDSNSITIDTVTKPVLDKRTGEILTIENVTKPISYSDVQSVSFRTVIKTKE